MKPPRGYESLRRSRTNIEGASYFVTACTHDRRTGLNSREPAMAITAELHSMDAEGSIVARAWVLMPDHLHWFFKTTGKLSLGQVIGRLKARTRRVLASRYLAWQGNYYEHRLGESDATEDVLLYLYLNPYRAGLVPPTALYPHFWIGAEDGAWFEPNLDDNRPFPEWLT